MTRYPTPCASATRPDLKALKRNRPKKRMTRLKKSMTAGKVCVVTRGPYMAKKVVFLKQLDSGLLLCACMNNEAVRRFPQKFLLTTSTSVGVKSVNVSDWSDDNFKALSGKADEGTDFFDKEAANTVPKEFSDAQAKVISAVNGAAKDEMLNMYLRARFTLTKDFAPHELTL